MDGIQDILPILLYDHSYLPTFIHRSSIQKILVPLALRAPPPPIKEKRPESRYSGGSDLRLTTEHGALLPLSLSSPLEK